MADARAVTLQINVAPTDFPHAVHTLPHQLRQWGGQVQEILFTFDLHRTPKGGRFGEGWEERLAPMQELLERLCSEHPHARLETVDYDPQRMAEVAEVLLGGSTMPVKDTKGAPFYPYFHGLYGASNELVLHLDSDMMFGGGSQSWIGEACELLQRDPDVLACNPLAGPPSPDGRLLTQQAEVFPGVPSAFRFASMNTRIYLLDRVRLRERLLPMALVGPIRALSRAKAKMHGNPPYGAAELVLGAAMRTAGMCRVDLLGSDPGMWSLHPPFRSPEFYRELPRLIEQVETGQIPAAQLGDYELGDAMLDWSRARRRARLRRIWA
jgi:hypothetical protein